MKDDILYLGHINNAIEAIEQYPGKASYQQFLSDKMMVDAIYFAPVLIIRIFNLPVGAGRVQWPRR